MNAGFLLEMDSFNNVVLYFWLSKDLKASSITVFWPTCDAVSLKNIKFTMPRCLKKNQLINQLKGWQTIHWQQFWLWPLLTVIIDCWSDKTSPLVTIKAVRLAFKNWYFSLTLVDSVINRLKDRTVISISLWYCLKCWYRYFRVHLSVHRSNTT